MKTRLTKCEYVITKQYEGSFPIILVIPYVTLNAQEET